MKTLFTAERSDWRKFPRIAALAAALLSIAPLAGAQGVKEPTWPQQFQVLQGENASYGFIVGQPGPITITVSSQGAPVMVELLGPLTQNVRQSGTGAINLAYTATAADVQKSSVWMVLISQVNPTQPQPGHAPTVVASGSITVHHPAGGGSIAHKAPQRSATMAPTRTAMKPTPNAAALMAAYASALAAQQQAEKQRLEHQLNASAPAAMKSTTRPPMKLAMGPRIDSMTVSKGQPGDFLMIYVSNYDRSGEVHFVVNPGMDVKATKDADSETRIMVHVPTVTGIGPYAGQVYVQLTGRSTAKTNSVPFAFTPTWEYVDLRPNVNDPDAHIDRTELASVCPADGGVCRDGSNDFFGHKGDDIFYATKMLKNGWLVESVSANGPWQVEGFGSAGNYLVDSRVGTVYPYAKVHWWMDALTSVNYAIVVVIKGPKGTPYQ